MNDKEKIEEAYRKMYEGMVAKDRELLNEALDDSYVLVHMTGMHQSKKEFIDAVMNGTLNYYSSEQVSADMKVDGDTAVMTGRSVVVAAVFGGGRGTWHLQQKCSLKKIDENWKITRSVVSTY